MAASLSLLELIACLVIGYGFGRFKFKGSNILFAFVLLTIIVPPQDDYGSVVLEFPIFHLIWTYPEPGLNLLGSSWPMALMAITGTAKRERIVYLHQPPVLSATCLPV